MCVRLLSSHITSCEATESERAVFFVRGGYGLISSSRRVWVRLEKSRASWGLSILGEHNSSGLVTSIRLSRNYKARPKKVLYIYVWLLSDVHM